MKKLILLGLVFGQCTFNQAQQVVKSTGKAEVMQSPSMSADAAKKEALSLAKINAIERVFGSYIEQDARMTVKNDKTYFNVIGGARVRGEWVETIGAPSYQYELREVTTATGKEPEIWWIVEVTGRVREINSAKVSFEVQPLRAPDLTARTDRFKNDEDFYLYFQSAESGYLSVYISSEGLAYRLLPYAQMDGPYLNAVPVQADRPYYFFDKKASADYFPEYPTSKVDELKMYTEQEVEVNELYIVFSKNPFSKPILSETQQTGDGYIMPKSLSLPKFEEWLEDNSAASVDFAYKRVIFEISKN